MKIRIGSRGSPLALRQADLVRVTLEERIAGVSVEIVKVKTTGDRVTDRALFVMGGKGLFTKELEDRLLDGSVDLAVHSLKDLPTDLPEGLATGAVLERGAPGDTLVTTGGRSFDELAPGAKVGTSSLRRRAQIRSLRPDLEVVDLRGNLGTRLEKLAAGDMDAMVAARAGLDRLGFDRNRFHAEDLTQMIPAPGQGAIAVETKVDREDLEPYLLALNHDETSACVSAERAFLSALGGGCHVPIGALASPTESGLTLVGLVAAVDGSRLIRRELTSNDSPEATGGRLAREILEAGGKEILEQLEDMEGPE